MRYILTGAYCYRDEIVRLQSLAAKLPHPLRFILQDGDVIAAYAHIAEVRRIDKTFIDCGGIVRKVATCSLQAWVADGTDTGSNPATNRRAGSGLLMSDELSFDRVFLTTKI